MCVTSDPCLHSLINAIYQTSVSWGGIVCIITMYLIHCGSPCHVINKKTYSCCKQVIKHSKLSSSVTQCRREPSINSTYLKESTSSWGLVAMNEKQTISQFGSQFYQHKFLTNSIHEEKCVSDSSLVVTYVLPALCKMPALMHCQVLFFPSQANDFLIYWFSAGDFTKKSATFSEQKLHVTDLYIFTSAVCSSLSFNETVRCSITA